MTRRLILRRVLAPPAPTTQPLPEDKFRWVVKLAWLEAEAPMFVYIRGVLRMARKVNNTCVRDELRGDVYHLTDEWVQTPNAHYMTSLGIAEFQRAFAANAIPSDIKP